MEFSFLLQLSRTFGYLSTSLLPQNARRRVILQNSVELKILVRNTISYKQKCKNNTIFFMCYAMKFDGLFPNYENIFS